MTQNFLADSEHHSSTPATVSRRTEAHPEQIKHMLLGSPKAVKRTIHIPHCLNYAEAGAWSPLVPTQNVGEVMSVLIRAIMIE